MSPCRGYLLRVLMVACAALTASGSPIAARPAAAPDDASSCAALKEWASAYTDKQPTLDELATFDRSHRAAILGALTPEARASLWQEQFRRFSKRTDLSNTQRAHVMRAISLVTPDLYRGASSDTREFEALWTEAEPSFTSIEHRRAWFQIGAITPSGQISIESTKLMGGGVICNCRSSGDCSGGVACGGGPCSGVMACGPGGTLVCHGLCQW